MDIKQALFRLNDFCSENKISYIITGTTALSILGVPSDFSPNDIDIKVFDLDNEQIKKLDTLQKLSGLNSSPYEDCKCYSFMIGNIKINAIIDDVIIDKEAVLTIISNKPVYIQRVKFALKDKMRLRRKKDNKYMLNLIANLASL